MTSLAVHIDKAFEKPGNIPGTSLGVKRRKLLFTPAGMSSGVASSARSKKHTILLLLLCMLYGKPMGFVSMFSYASRHGGFDRELLGSREIEIF